MLYLHTSGPSVAAGEFDNITAACRWIHQKLISKDQGATGRSTALAWSAERKID